MNKIIVLLMFVALLLVIIVGKPDVLASDFESTAYPKYREEYAYNLKNPLLERYRKLVIESPPKNLDN